MCISLWHPKTIKWKELIFVVFTDTFSPINYKNFYKVTLYFQNKVTWKIYSNEKDKFEKIQIIRILFYITFSISSPKPFAKNCY